MYKYFSIIGFGKSGVGAAKFLLGHYSSAKIRVSDLKTRENFLKLENDILDLQKQGVEFEFGKQNLDFISFADLKVQQEVFVMLSPGIPPASKLIKDLKSIESQGQISLGTDFDLFVDNLAKEQNYIAITGTNGKTTTTSLVAHIIGSEAVGNIGKPFLEFDPTSPYIACEISSFQLFHSSFPCHPEEPVEAQRRQGDVRTPFAQDDKKSIKLPKAAIYLNLTDDHLDWHADLDEYKEAKAKLFQISSSQENFLIFNYDDAVCDKLAERRISEIQANNSRTKIALFSTRTELLDLNETQSISAFLRDNTLYVAKYLSPGSNDEVNYNGLVVTNDNGDYILEIPVVKINEINLVGEHNYSNMLAAILGTFVTDIDFDLLVSKLKSFVAVPHRLEYLATVDGHRVFNDSKATNPDSAAKALESFDKPIIIVGGKNKYLDLNPFFDLLTQKAYAVVAIGELKDSFYQGLQARHFDKVSLATDLKDAFDKCLEYGRDNDLPIVLSPASSSFDMFSGYEERGDVFRNIVKNALK